VCARHLYNYGTTMHVVVSAEDDRFTSIPAHQLDILRRMGVPINREIDSTIRGDLIVDGLIGYSLKGTPRQPIAQFIRWANQSGMPVLALDAPSGIDTTTGTVYDPAIRATATMTLALPKEGLRAGSVADQVGELYLADISVPTNLYSQLQLTVGPIFARKDIVRLR
jgi:NAD(P)H-hydrate epimerase